MINEFYLDKTILLTGGTGFLGIPLTQFYSCFRQGCTWKNTQVSTYN